MGAVFASARALAFDAPDCGLVSLEFSMATVLSSDPSALRGRSAPTLGGLRDAGSDPRGEGWPWFYCHPSCRNRNRTDAHSRRYGKIRLSAYLDSACPRRDVDAGGIFLERLKAANVDA